MTTLYQKLGGAPVLDVVVDKFYERMLSDPSVSHFFKQTDMIKQKQRQKQFLTMVTGGPHNYQGKDMKTAHAKFKIGKKQFDTTWNHMEFAFKFYHISDGLVHNVKTIFYFVEGDIVNSKDGAANIKEPIKEQKKSLYQRLGAQAGINAVVDKFYQFMLLDPKVSPFFANTDMKKQATRQKQFIAMATGGPNNYQGADMKTAHKKFNIGKDQFDETWRNLQRSLVFYKVGAIQISQLKDIVYSTQHDIVHQISPLLQEQSFKDFSKQILINPNVKLFKNMVESMKPVQEIKPVQNIKPAQNTKPAQNIKPNEKQQKKL